MDETMDLAALPQSPPVACSDAEWQTRVELAALYRLLDHYSMSDLANQVSGARIKVASSGGRPRLINAQHVARFQDQMYASEHYNYDGSTEWAALIRKLDREQPDYKT